MALFKCKMCGGQLDIIEGATIIECEYCGTKQTLPKLDNDRRINMYDRANHFRRNNEFDKAMGIYEQILNEDSTDGEAYWSLVLCRYGIEYVEDARTRKRIPTINRTQFTSIFDDENYKSALQYADIFQRHIYEEEAKTINEIQKGILSIVQKEEPFDVFICYKETDHAGGRTPDSVFAQDLYHQLTLEGLKVFFSRITLEDKLGSAYEPYIFAALNSAKVMVVIGTRVEYFKAVWVKNEWSRFLSISNRSNGEKVLIPAYKDIDPYDLPEEFSHLQAQDMSKLGFMQDLTRGIKKIVNKNTSISTTSQNSNSNIAPLIERIFMFLEDGDFSSADKYCEKVLDIDPKCARAYLGKLMAQFKKNVPSQIADINVPIENNTHYKRIMSFGDQELKNDFEKYLVSINKNVEIEKARQIEEAARLELAKKLQEIEEEKKKEQEKLDKTLKIALCHDGEYCVLKKCLDYNEKNIVVPALYKNAPVIRIEDCAFQCCRGAEQITLPNTLEIIGNRAFEKCTSLQHINIPGSVKVIGEYAFFECISLETLTIPSSIERIDGGAFLACPKLKHIEYEGTTSNWNSILQKSQFGGKNKYPVHCSDTEQIEAEKAAERQRKKEEETEEQRREREYRLGSKSGFTFIKEGKSYVLDKCSNTGRMKDIPNMHDGCPVIKIDDFAFSECYDLEKVIIPNTVTAIGGYAFSGCELLTDVQIGNSLMLIGHNAFQDCGSLININLPDSLTAIKECAFNGCTSLKDIKLPSSLKTIGEYAFNSCTSLKSIEIPISVTKIGDSAFYKCTALKEIKYPGTTAQWNRIAPTNLPSLCKVHCSDTEIIAERKARNLCQHCGGQFKGLFTKKCSNCGQEKNY